MGLFHISNVATCWKSVNISECFVIKAEKNANHHFIVDTEKNFT